jgi:pyruvate ferredoxin oxidoreductase gamma subunit
LTHKFEVENIIEIRIHGRGGQGAVTSAELLAKAAGLDNRFSQAFPAFGPERRGAPVRAFCRIDDRPITTRQQVYSPDYVVILDPTLAELPEVSEGLKPESRIIANSESAFSVCGREAEAFDATCIAIRVIGKPIVNTAMLGAFAGKTGLVSLESLKKVIGERFGGKVGEANMKLVEEAFSAVKDGA